MSAGRSRSPSHLNTFIITTSLTLTLGPALVLSPTLGPTLVLYAQAVLDYSGALSALQRDAEATLEVEDASEAQLQQEQLQQQLELQPQVSTGELLGRQQQQLLQPQGRLPAKAVVLFNRGSSLHRQGQHRAAVEDLNEALSLAPLRADFYENRAPAWSRSSSLAAAELATHLTGPRHLRTRMNARRPPPPGLQSRAWAARAPQCSPWACLRRRPKR